MTFFFLDMGGAGLFQAILVLGILFILLATLVEAVAMILLKYNRPFKKAITDSLLANGASLLIGLLMMNLEVEIFDYADWLNFLILYGLTVIIEVIILYLRNRSKPFPKTLIACLFMNLVSYGLLYLFSFIV